MSRNLPIVTRGFACVSRERIMVLRMGLKSTVESWGRLDFGGWPAETGAVLP